MLLRNPFPHAAALFDKDRLWRRARSTAWGRSTGRPEKHASSIDGGNRPAQLSEIRALTFPIPVHVLWDMPFDPLFKVCCASFFAINVVRSKIAFRASLLLSGVGETTFRALAWAIVGIATESPPGTPRINGSGVLKSRAMAAQSQPVGRGWR